ncbi:MAG: dTDP-4-dehydrorhamnose reductase family protein [Pyrinomonadaceae bacterium]
MRILILGATGMLGHKLLQQLGRRMDVWGAVRGDGRILKQLEIVEPERIISSIEADDERSLRSAIEICRPDVVVNAVGIVKQLPASADVITTLNLNSILPHRLAQLGEEYGFRLITISTDCVFTGKEGIYTEDDPPDARDLYGLSKFLGEVNSPGALTIRTSIIGPEIGSGHGLLEWFLSNRGGRVKGLPHAIFSGFPTIVFADIIERLITGHPGLSGIYHVSSEPISKLDLLHLFNEYYAAGVEIEPDDSVTIDRSLDSGRFRAEVGFVSDDWRTMVRRMADDATPYKRWIEKTN